ncbi:MAG: SGNH/GDSL hydrolase family protein [Clostridia bacterium]|nr:SGNH/GDSL hydrolase family protein [Clostridia bacterium]
MDLKNLKINFLGDSITEGCGASDFSKGYVNLIHEKYGAVCRNYGVGGSRIARQQGLDEYLGSNRDYVMRAQEMDLDADLVSVFGGTNDFGHGNVPLGTFEDRDVFTFYGALHTLCIYLLTNFTKSQLMIITPFHRLNEENGCMDYNGNLKPDLETYVNAIRKVAEYYSIPVLDLYANSGIQPNVPSIKETYMPDGLHPNDLGYELLADKIAKFIQAL